MLSRLQTMEMLLVCLYTLMAKSTSSRWRAARANTSQSAGSFTSSQMVQPSPSRPSRMFLVSSSRRSAAFSSAMLWLDTRTVKKSAILWLETRTVKSQQCCGWKQEYSYRSAILWLETRTVKKVSNIVAGNKNSYRSAIQWLETRTVYKVSNVVDTG